jgi:hypothetical protein
VADTCLIDHPRTADSCDEPAMATIIFGCAHEHIDRPRSCAACAVDVQHCAGDMICPHCRDGTAPHVCMCLVVIDWDSGEKTIVQEPDRERPGA